MREYIITTGTITYALKGRDLLRKNGIKARVERITSGKGSSGCGYAIISNDRDRAEEILRKGSIKIIEINERA